MLKKVQLTRSHLLTRWAMINTKDSNRAFYSVQASSGHSIIDDYVNHLHICTHITLDVIINLEDHVKSG